MLSIVPGSKKTKKEDGETNPAYLLIVKRFILMPTKTARKGLPKRSVTHEMA